MMSKKNSLSSDLMSVYLNSVLVMNLTHSLPVLSSSAHVIRFDGMLHALPQD